MKLDSLGRINNPKSHLHKLTHGGFKYHKATYQCWQDMKQRCYNPNAKQYKNYGGRGITVCQRWLNDFEMFFADMGEKPEGMTIERINTNRNYSPSNCKWASMKEQNNNKRLCRLIRYKGKMITAAQLAEIIGLHPDTIRRRMNSGWPTSMIISGSRFFCGNISAIAARKEGK